MPKFILAKTGDWLGGAVRDHSRMLDFDRRPWILAVRMARATSLSNGWESTTWPNRKGELKFAWAVRTQDGILTERFLRPGLDRAIGDEISDEDLTPYPPASSSVPQGVSQ